MKMQKLKTSSLKMSKKKLNAIGKLVNADLEPLNENVK